MSVHGPKWIAIILFATSAACDRGSTATGGSGGDSGGAGGGGSAAGGGGPLSLVSATFVSSSEVKLVFSEAVKPPTGVDPKAFRLSAAVTTKPHADWTCRCDGDQYYSRTTMARYASRAACLSHHTGDDTYACGCSYCGCSPSEIATTAYYDIGTFAHLDVGAEADEIIAKLGAPAAGNTDDPFGPNGPCGTLFLHYAEESRGIESRRSRTLGSIAPAWADNLSADNLQVDGALPDKPHPVSSDFFDKYCGVAECHDGKLDGKESDVDCGGDKCARCPLGKVCRGDSDCSVGICLGAVCTNCSCTNGVKDPGESDVDCGGGICPGCAPGKKCSGDHDCEVGPCSNGTCVATCVDGVKDQGEAGIDCGPPCAGCVGDPCASAADCETGNCQSLQCANAAIAAISAGGCAITTNGGLKCWGDASTPARSLVPHDVAGSTSGVTDVSVGLQHACALLAGEVWCWGSNGFGQLGDGTTTDRVNPTAVSGLIETVTAISAADDHTCVLTSGGGVKCWGYNGIGGLGDGTTTNRTTPVDVSGLSAGVIAISTGLYASCALTSSGGVKCWGSNQLGSVGDGTTAIRLTPVDVVGLSGGVVAISTGTAHSCALTNAGGVKCWGDNTAGDLGDGSANMSPQPLDVSGLAAGVAAIAAGGDTTCALTSSGAVKCWGDNITGSIGDGTTNPAATPRDVPSLPTGVVAISTRSSAALFMGHGTYSSTSCAMTNSAHALCWGNNRYGQIGDGTMDSTTPEHLTPTDVYGL